MGQGFGSPSCSHHPRQSLLSGSHQPRGADVTRGTTLCSKLFSLSPNLQPGGSQGWHGFPGWIHPLLLLLGAVQAMEQLSLKFLQSQFFLGVSKCGQSR